MKWTVLPFSLSWLVVSAALTTTTTTTTTAAAAAAKDDPGVASRPQENRSGHVDPAVYFSGARAVEREGALLLLKDYMHQGDTLLKERVKDSYSSLKDMLKQGDSVLKEQLTEAVAQLKEQRKEGDGRLKEELDEDVAWLKDRLAEGQTRVKEEMAEEEAEVKQELARQREALDTLKASVRESIHVKSDDLTQQMSDFREELKNTKLQLQTELQSTQETVRKAEEDLQQEMQLSTELKGLLQAAQEELLSLKVRSQQCSHRLDLLESSDLGQGHGSGDSGSTFIRWGRTTCPDNTSLVYSGVVGGTWHEASGGGSNYLCLVNDPQLDNMTLPKHYSQVYGSEYEYIGEHGNQDVVCSVCRAPQATTIMIPAKVTCPEGWIPQYTGHLVSEHPEYKGRTEYVCLDEMREGRDGGYENKKGVLMYLVASVCGSLPCPPYSGNKVVTCVVCSM